MLRVEHGTRRKVIKSVWVGKNLFFASFHSNGLGPNLFHTNYKTSIKRHHIAKKSKSGVELTELGPRMDLQPYKVVLGTLENLETSETEWVYKPYLNTAHKKFVLS